MRRRALGAGRDAKGRQASPRATPAEPGGHPEAELRTRAGPRAGAQVSPGAAGPRGAGPGGWLRGGRARGRGPQGTGAHVGLAPSGNKSGVRKMRKVFNQ